MVQQFRFWICTQENWKQGLQERFIHSSQKRDLFTTAKMWKQSDDDQQTEECIWKRGTSLQGDTHPWKGKVAWHGLQRAWTVKAFCWVKPVTRRHRLHDSLTCHPDAKAEWWLPGTSTGVESCWVGTAPVSQPREGDGGDAGDGYMPAWMCRMPLTVDSVYSRTTQRLLRKTLHTIGSWLSV